MDELKTSEEWQKQYQISIVDPDGWRGKDAIDWFNDKISLYRFWYRICVCTIKFDSNFYKLEADAMEYKTRFNVEE